MKPLLPLSQRTNPVPAVPADQTSIAAGGGFDILTAVAALTGQSASQLRALAERYRHREGVVRTPLVLLQVLALSRQFECTRVYPSVEQSAADATAGVAAVKAMEAQVDAYGQAMWAHGQCKDSYDRTAFLPISWAGGTGFGSAISCATGERGARLKFRTHEQ